MIADCDAKGAEGITDQQKREIEDRAATAPEAVDGVNGGTKRHPDQKLENDLC